MIVAIYTSVGGFHSVVKTDVVQGLLMIVAALLLFTGVTRAAGGVGALGGAGLARGYWADPALTAVRFVPDPQAGQAGARLYRSGDLGRWSRSGELLYDGRSDHQIKLRGMRIEPAEIEVALRRLDGVDDAVALLRRSDRGEEQLVAWVAAAGAPPPEPGELRQALALTLPAPCVPAAVVVLRQLPLSPNGKLDRRALPAPARRAAAGRPPQGRTEELLATIWKEVLGLDRVSAEEDFFALGGHSLFATQVVSRIRSVLAVEVPLRAVFEAPTIAALARVTDESGRSNRDVLAPIEARRQGGDGEAFWPLSFSQRRLWFIDRLQPHSSAYNLPFSVRLRGTLRGAALAASLDEIVRRHESLRTVFSELDGAPVQRVASSWGRVLALADLSALPVPAAEVETQRLALAEAARPFSLAGPPFLRALLIRLRRDQHVLTLTMHHIASDGWSVGILIRELEALYSAAVLGERSPLPELAVQYADYALWQEKHLSPVLEAEAAFWKQQLDALEPLALPLDRARSRQPSSSGRTWTFALPTRVAERFAAAFRGAGMTPFMAYLAAFQLLLHRITGQRDVAVGTPVAGRGASNSESLIGFFVNNLVLRTVFDAATVETGLTVRELFSRVRGMTLAAYSHEHLPFEKLVEVLQPQRDLSRTPLFDVMFTFQHQMIGTAGLLDVEVEPFLSAGGAGGVRFDLSWSFEETEDGIRGAAAYRRELFDASTIQRLAAQLVRLVDSMAGSPESPVASLPLLGRGERHQLLAEWNDSAGDAGSLSLASLIAAQGRARPDAVAIVGDQLTLSYGALLRRASALARGLRSRGVGPEARVGIYMERCPQRVVALLGVLQAGAAFVPIDPQYPRRRVAWMLRDSRLSVVLSGPQEARAIPSTEVPVLDSLALAEEAGGGRSGPSPTHDLDQLAYAIYTSGSTGRPKGVAVSHRALLNHMRWQQALYPLEPGDTVLHTTPMSFDPAVCEVLAPLWVGARLCLARPQGDRDPAYLVDAIERWSVTALQVVPSLLRWLLEAEGLAQRCATLTRIYSGGEVLTRELAERCEASFGGTLINVYGPAEATIRSSSWRGPVRADGRVPLGRPIANARVRVVDRGLRPVPPGVRGEIVIGGLGLARGYLGQPGLTAELFVPDPESREPGARGYRSGDLGRWSPSGELLYDGRIDHQIKLRGVRVEPAEIESALRRLDAVDDAVALALERPTGPQLSAFISPAGERMPDASVLRQLLRQSLPEPLIPQVFIERRVLPRSPSGKADRGALQRQAEVAVRPDTAASQPRDRYELQLVRLWEELLGVDRVGIRDDFFALGGHSLLAVRLLQGVEDLFAVDIPLASLFQESTVAGLAETVRRRLTQSTPPSPLLPIRLTPGAPAWYFVHPVGGQVHWYLELARALGDTCSFYGLQAPGLAKSELVRSDLGEIAGEYAAAIREAQPRGPYRLAGWSYGGIVAFEIAQQLVAAGEQVEPVVLIDALLRSDRKERPATETDLWLNLLADMSGSTGIDRIAWRGELEPLDRDGRLRRVAARLAEWGALPAGGEVLERMLAVHFSMTRAVEGYEARPYAGAGILIRARESARKHAGVAALSDSHGWRDYFESGLVVHDVAGDHYSILAQDGARALAEILRQEVRHTPPPSSTTIDSKV